MLPLTKKYKPKKLAEVVGQLNSIRALRTPTTRPLLLYGPSGTGKTSAVHALANEQKAELIELNASNFRNKEAIDTILKPATQQASLFGTKKIILVDEVDCLSGTKDRGAIPAVIKVIKDSKFPLIFTANDPWKSKLSSLRKYCTLIQFNKIHPNTISNHLAKICKLENIKADQLALTQLAYSADGDLRASLNDLQIMSTTGEIKRETLTLWGREREDTIFNALRVIFKSSTIGAAVKAVDEITEEPQIISFWLDQNIPLEYKPLELGKAYNHLSVSDIYLRRIMRRQHWRYIIYSKALLGPGIQQAKDIPNNKFIKYQKPEVLQKIYIRAAKQKKLRGLASQIQSKLHTSTKALQRDFLPYLKFIQEHNTKLAEEIKEYLAL